ncbi:hypothetical protein [Seonamhaeicola maritimus]|uniref:Lipocalin-like domain-containing protein n=1 Tax=Seonamhaeicola maritimus TaxID=2591822 RepID=A0A5C7GDI9_9FLAO|nr:hypothetical protein [Seonamhaeicola maritimus]TXG34736.1 hypothetical protein FUA22_17665 [Seonamhaeicola maritimus]
MRVLTCFLVIVLSLSCAEPKADNKSVVSSNPYLIGTWSGEGKFLNIDFNKEIGVIPIQMEIKDNYEISGTIGDSELVNTSIAEVGYGFEIRGELSSKIKATSKITKDHLIILLVLPEDGREKVQMSTANFHLKSNYTFDFDMRVGGVNLMKN